MGVKEKKIFFFDLRSRSGLMLDGYLMDFGTEKRFQENGRLGAVCHHLGCDAAPGGSVRGAQKWGKNFARAFLGAKSVLHRANDFGMSKIDVKPHSLPIPTFICNLSPKLEE